MQICSNAVIGTYARVQGSRKKLQRHMHRSSGHRCDGPTDDLLTANHGNTSTVEYLAVAAVVVGSCQHILARMFRLALLLALLTPAAAFVPSTGRVSASFTALDAMSRRDTMGLAFAGLVAGVLPQDASAANPGKLTGFVENV